MVYEIDKEKEGPGEKKLTKSETDVHRCAGNNIFQWFSSFLMAGSKVMPLSLLHY